ncbi:MAG: SGNH/GDSL hydrolase family protein, partial [Trueperaceae bacterium]|nr:SGNH/GDSL hydrolase family protein [Trueperaceae bacterium]
AKTAQVIRVCAREIGLPLADVYASWQALAEEGQDTNYLLANGLNHPTAEGHRLTAELIFELITKDEV